jgi:dimethylargininase
MELIAITREISASIVNCELTHLRRQPIDLELARRQHRQYKQALQALGCQVIALPEQAELPDAVFVEDVAIVLDEIAILTRPGAQSRRAEVETVAQALQPYRNLLRIQPPGRLDGGDVLRVEKTIYIGLSSRSNPAAIEQMESYLAPFGYRVQGVPVSGCLHLKSAVTQVAEKLLLINPGWVSPAYFAGMHLIEVAPEEPSAANALWIGDTVLYPTAYPSTRQRLEAHGLRVMLLEASEVAKAEGALTCCSLIFERQ